jgi:GSH-dependent disulfide-bond oxidoreductase
VFRRRQELGFEMIDLYTAPTPNGWKATVALEELGLEYRLHPIDLSAGEQRHEDFWALNPNGRIPVIVDREGGRSRVIFESGAILLYLAEKTGRLMPADVDGKYEVIQWLMFQVGGIGPMQGQATALKRCSAGADPAQTRRGGSTPTSNSVQEGEWGRCYAEGGRET